MTTTKAMITTFPFIGFRDGRNTYALLCPSCKAEGELGIRPDKAQLTECPNKCGAMFLQRWPRGMFSKPSLDYVIGGKLRNHIRRLQ